MHRIDQIKYILRAYTAPTTVSMYVPCIKSKELIESSITQAFSDLICLQFYDSFEIVAEPFYVYEFTFDGERNVFKSMFLQNIHQIKGKLKQSGGLCAYYLWEGRLSGLFVTARAYIMRVQRSQLALMMYKNTANGLCNSYLVTALERQISQVIYWTKLAMFFLEGTSKYPYFFLSFNKRLITNFSF